MAFRARLRFHRGGGIRQHTDRRQWLAGLPLIKPRAGAGKQRHFRREHNMAQIRGRVHEFKAFPELHARPDIPRPHKRKERPRTRYHADTLSFRLLRAERRVFQRFPGRLVIRLHQALRQIPGEHPVLRRFLGMNPSPFVRGVTICLEAQPEAARDAIACVG